MKLCVLFFFKKGRTHCWSQTSNENRRWILHSMARGEVDAEKEKREWKCVCVWVHKTDYSSFSTRNDCCNVCSLHTIFKIGSQIDWMWERDWDFGNTVGWCKWTRLCGVCSIILAYWGDHYISNKSEITLHQHCSEKYSLKDDCWGTLDRRQPRVRKEREQERERERLKAQIEVQK